MPLKKYLPTLIILLVTPALAQQPSAPISLLMYVDLECPFSATTLPAVERLIRQHPNQIHLDLRQFPLTQHLDAPLAHEAALAADAQGKYLEMVDLIQANQTRMTRAQYLTYAAHLHLDVKRFAHDLDTHRFAPAIRRDLSEGQALGIDVTPTLFLNGQRLNGAQDQQALEVALQRALSSASVPAQPTAPITLTETDLKTLAQSPISTGPTDAPVTIVEFTDFQCPFCRRAAEPMHQLLAQSGANVKWVYRSFPLDFHDHAEPAAEAALAAAAQGQFWPMHDLLFANQATLDRDHFDQFARQLKLEMTRFDHDLDTGTYRAQIAADRALGQRYGVDGTPAFFVNGQAITGARTLPELQQAVQLALNELGQPEKKILLAKGDKPAVGDDLSSFRIAGGPVSRSATEARVGHLLPTTASTTSITPTVDWFLDIETSASLAIASAIEQFPPDTRIAIHSYTLPTHPNAQLAFRALTVAAQSSTPTPFWALYNTLAAQSLPADDPAARRIILAAATAAGLDPAAIAAAFDDPQLTQDIAVDKQNAYRRGIRGVPVVFIADRRIDGVQPLIAYTQALAAQTSQTTASLTTH